MNKTFIKGRHYTIRKDYPRIKGLMPFMRNDIKFEGRVTCWVNAKMPILSGKPFKVLDVRQIVDGCKQLEVNFEGIIDGFWNYYPEDFEEVYNDNDIIKILGE